MKPKMRKSKRFLLMAIMSCAFISVYAQASAISFSIEQLRALKLDFIKIDNLKQPISAVKLGKKSGGDIEQVKLSKEETKTKKDINRNNILGNSAGWYELRDAYNNNINTNAAVIDKNLNNSEPFHNPIPATIWILGASLATLIIIRRKIRSLTS